MASENIVDTQPTNVNSAPPERVKPKRGRWILLGILIWILATIIGGCIGYSNGIAVRKDNEKEQIARKAAEYFNYGVASLDAGNFTIAKAQLEYVLELDPSFPGLVDKLTQLQMSIAQAMTPTATPTLQPTATPDTRGIEELYNQAVSAMNSGDWQTLLNTLDAMRNNDITYKTLEVDGMYYIGLRYRGVQEIVYDGMLEEGGYLLSLASKFAPLDQEAINYREWARRYMSATSFWAVDWERVVNEFQVVAGAVPNMRDASGLTAMDRYYQALVGFGDDLMVKSDPCRAEVMYTAAHNMRPNDELALKVSDANTACIGTQPTAEPTMTPTVSPTGGITEIPAATTVVPTEVTPEVTP